MSRKVLLNSKITPMNDKDTTREFPTIVDEELKPDQCSQGHEREFLQNVDEFIVVNKIENLRDCVSEESDIYAPTANKSQHHSVNQHLQESSVAKTKRQKVTKDIASPTGRKQRTKNVIELLDDY